MTDIFLNIEVILLLAGFLIVALAAERIAAFFQKHHWPFITGLMLTGIVTGPFVLDLISDEAISQLGFINDVALAFIAFAAGSELYLNELRNKLRVIQISSITQILVTLVLTSGTFMLVVDYVPMMRDQPPEIQFFAAILTGVIFSTRSLASAMAVLSELRAKGPYTQTVLGVIVLKDFVVIVLFSIILSFGKSIITGHALNFLSVIFIFFELLVSFGVGLVLGKVMQLTFSIFPNQKIRYAAILFEGFLVYHFTPAISALIQANFGFDLSPEPLLICITGSFFITNYSKFRSDFLEFIKDSSKYVYLLFFLLIGISLSMEVILDIWFVALLFFVLRITTLSLGSYFSGFLTQEPIMFQRVGWMTYITQAGYALGLSSIMIIEFPGWGEELATLIIAVVIYSQILGPVLFKKAIIRVGENHDRAEPGEDTDRDAVIIGFESMSVALAHQLIDKGWHVQIATIQPEGSFEKPEGIEIRHLKSIDVDSLKEIHADKAEAIVSMLSDKENIEVCKIAYEHFGTRDLVMRMTDTRFADQYLSYNARVVNPSTAMVNLLEHFVRSPQATSLILGMESGQDSRDILLQDPNLHGMALRDLRLPSDVIILSVRRDGHFLISHGYTRLRKGDVITMVGSNKSLEDMALKFGI